MLLARFIASWSIVLGLLGCADLPEIPANQCGNFVVEAAEDCDGYVDNVDENCAGNIEDASRYRCRAPSETNACRFDCSESSIRCPCGWSCGTDHICHMGTGTYQRWGEELPLQAHGLKLGDLDGDGRADLLTLGHPNALWQSEPRLVFFDTVGDAKSIFDPQGLVSFPTFSEPIQTTGSLRPRQRIIASTYLGIAELVADSKQQVTPVAYPFQSMPGDWSYRMVRVRGAADNPLREQVLLYESDGRLSVASSDIALGNLGRPLQALSSDPIAVNFPTDSKSPCDQLILTFHGDRNVYASELCDADGHWLQNVTGPHPIANLPEGHSAETGAMFVRLNDDPLLDLIVGDERGHPYVAFGRIDGTFAADPSDPTSETLLWPVVMQTDGCMLDVPLTASYPLAVGDLNGDERADWVLPDAVALGHEFAAPDAINQRVLVTACAYNGPAAAPWTVARIADLNRDGLADLIAGSKDTWDLELFRGTGQDFLSKVNIPTDGPVSHIITGDFDGDLNTDIAFVQQVRAPDLGSKASSVAIAYGVPFGTPTAPSTIAQFVSVDQLASANFANADTMEEIGVTGQTTESSDNQLVLFVGNAGRHPIASLGLNKATEGQQYIGGSSLALTTGHFVSNETEDVLALAVGDCGSTDCQFRLWFVPRRATGRLSNPTYSDPIAPEAVVFRTTSRELSLHFVTGQVDGDGLTDALLMTSTPDETGVSLWRVALPSASDGQYGPGSPLTFLSAMPGQLSATSAPLLLDLNHDNLGDLVTLLQDETGTPQLAVTWNDFGLFDLATAIPIDVDGTPVRAITGTGQESEFWVATDSGVYKVGPDQSAADSRLVGRGLQAAPIRFGDGTIPVGPPFGVAVAVGDVTGDGLPDLAVSDLVGVRLYAEVPTRP